MSRIKVESIIDIYEIDGKGTGFDRPHVFVRSHRNSNKMVNLLADFGDDTAGHEIAVFATDLEAAIGNARNSG